MCLALIEEHVKTQAPLCSSESIFFLGLIVAAFTPKAQSVKMTKKKQMKVHLDDCSTEMVEWTYLLSLVLTKEFLSFTEETIIMSFLRTKDNKMCRMLLKQAGTI